MIIKITIDRLTENTVSVKTEKYIEDGVQEIKVGNPHRKAYVNSAVGRAQVQADLPEPQRNAIFEVWGSEPTVDESNE